MDRQRNSVGDLPGGLSAFPITPVTSAGVDLEAFQRIVVRLVAAGVDSIGALGSTGSSAYLSREERRAVAGAAVRAAAGVPVLVGIGALRTDDVLRHADDAQVAGAAAVLLAPVSYQPLTDDEVFGLYEDVSARCALPLCVYDNPGTTGFTFSDELHIRIAALATVAAVKLPGMGFDVAAERLPRLREAFPHGVSIGVSGDWLAADGLLAGADTFFSVLGGLLPHPMRALTRSAQSGDAQTARAISAEFEPLWMLFRRYGSIRVVSAAAELLGLSAAPNLPRPLLPLPATGREALAALLPSLTERR
ncbi:dihydrodipicolinate synthase family protein [Lysobacter korlensis]|uniref:Dihydrodipicolinate synthase family protein n=1 Tax=Lysobacter korlensis TaxID=553636 RepID=A0ABV6S052_9GAMM